MVISEPGLAYLESSEYRLVRGFASLWFGSRETPAVDPYTSHLRLPFAADPIRSQPVSPGPGLTLAAVTSNLESAVTREGAVSEQLPEPEAVAPLTAQERRARAAAWRGLLLGRQRRYAAAQAAFTEAARLDAELHLESVPTFWHMERGAHEAAVRAYEAAERQHDAAMLASRLRTTYRPRLLNPRVTTPSPVG